MYNIEVHQFINQILQTFYRCGMWRNENGSENVPRKQGWKLSYLIFNMIYIVSLLSGGILSDDKNESIFLIASGIEVSVITVKLVYILWKKYEICEFILEIGTHSIADHEEFVKTNNKIKNLLKFSSGFILMSYGVVGGFIIFKLPIFTSQKTLPLNIWFPLDWKNNLIGYWTAYTFASTGCLLNCISMLLNPIVWYLMMNCAIKYQILGNQIRSIASVKPTIRKRKISDNEKQKLFLEELIGLVKTHRNIQTTIDRFKACFANLFFAQIATSGICICGSVYVLAFSNIQGNLLQVATNSFFLVYSLFDIFMVMYFGNEIKLSSDRLSYRLFQSNWIEQSKSCKKCIIILTEILKQPNELVIGKLYPLTLETFTSILNLAYSIFNILQNLN